MNLLVVFRSPLSKGLRLVTGNSAFRELLPALQLSKTPLQLSESAVSVLIQYPFSFELSGPRPGEGAAEDNYHYRKQTDTHNDHAVSESWQLVSHDKISRNHT